MLLAEYSNGSICHQQVAESKVYVGGNIQLKHELCSTHDDRLAVAERLLAAQGLLGERDIAELGSCINVPVKSALNAKALERQVTALCGVGAAARLAYTGWSGTIGDHLLFVSGDYISLTGPGEPPKPVSN